MKIRTVFLFFMYDKEVLEMTRKREVTFPENLISIIITNIIKYRKEEKMTQQQLAEDVGISYDHIRRMESTLGKEGLALKTFVKIAKVLNRSLDDFIK